jgi:rubrerythrin
MSGYDLVDGVLAFAIRKEEEAAELYGRLAEAAELPEARETYAALAKEEERHRDFLLDLRARKEFPVEEEEDAVLDPSAWIGELEPTPDLEYPDVLLFAVLREQEAINLYRGLARVAGDDALRSALETLVAEEMGHRSRLEAEYRSANPLK